MDDHRRHECPRLVHPGDPTVLERGTAADCMGRQADSWMLRSGSVRTLTMPVPVLMAPSFDSSPIQCSTAVFIVVMYGYPVETR